MTLKAGDTLPSSLTDHFGAEGKLQVLYFMRTADCAVCRGHVKRLMELSPRLHELGADLTIFAPDEEAPAWLKNLPARLVLGSKAYESADFHRTLGAIQQSGTITSRRDGSVLHVRKASLPFQAFHEGELLDLLQRGS